MNSTMYHGNVYIDHHEDVAAMARNRDRCAGAAASRGQAAARPAI